MCANLQYRSPWPYPPTPDCLALRGENITTKSASTNDSMIKVETEQEDLQYSVDPHLIQPTLEDLLIEKSLVNQEDAQSLPIVDGSIRMEHCINLDLYLAPIHGMMEPCFADELDTPDTFEARNDLKKSINTTTATMHQKQSVGNPFNFSAAATQPAITSVNLTEENKINSTHIFGNKIISSAMHGTIPHHWQDGDASTAECGGLLSPSRFDIDMEDINLSEYDFLHDCQDAIDAENASNVMDNNATPSTIAEHHNYALKLNIDNSLPNLSQLSDVLETPDIISTILQYENFEVTTEPCQVSFVTAEDIKEELLDSPTSGLSPQPATPETTDTIDDENSMHSIASSSTATTTATVVKRIRRRKRDSDDEDYVPPSKTPRRAPTRRRLKVESEDFDDEDSVEGKPPKRGRPAKPVSARSSESSECSRYREMRDKNNEASRRSRRKRRLQEQNVELECETLNEKNVRLKTQVAELEKSVASYRSNLMSLLLKRA